MFPMAWVRVFITLQASFVPPGVVHTLLMLFVTAARPGRQLY